MKNKIQQSLLSLIARAFVLACAVLFSAPSFAESDTGPQMPGPLNSDPLTERGISPRVLDIALFPLALV